MGNHRFDARNREIKANEFNAPTPDQATHLQ